MYIVCVGLHRFSRMVGAIFLWYSYTWTLTFNGWGRCRATCWFKKLIMSLSLSLSLKCSLDTRLVWLVTDLYKLIMCIHVSIEPWSCARWHTYHFRSAKLIFWKTSLNIFVVVVNHWLRYNYNNTRVFGHNTFPPHILHFHTMAY